MIVWCTVLVLLVLLLVVGLWPDRPARGRGNTVAEILARVEREQLEQRQLPER